MSKRKPSQPPQISGFRYMGLPQHVTPETPSAACAQPTPYRSTNAIPARAARSSAGDAQGADAAAAPEAAHPPAPQHHPRKIG